MQQCPHLEGNIRGVRWESGGATTFCSSASQYHRTTTDIITSITWIHQTQQNLIFMEMEELIRGTKAAFVVPFAIVNEIAEAA